MYLPACRMSHTGVRSASAITQQVAQDVALRAATDPRLCLSLRETQSNAGQCSLHLLHERLAEEADLARLLGTAVCHGLLVA